MSVTSYKTIMAEDPNNLKLVTSAPNSLSPLN